MKLCKYVNMQNSLPLGLSLQISLPFALSPDLSRSCKLLASVFFFAVNVVLSRASSIISLGLKRMGKPSIILS